MTKTADRDREAETTVSLDILKEKIPFPHYVWGRSFHPILLVLEIGVRKKIVSLETVKMRVVAVLNLISTVSY